MDVVLFVLRAIVIDDCLDGRDVKATRGDISGNQDVDDAAANFGQDRSPLWLGLVAMDRRQASWPVDHREV